VSPQALGEAGQGKLGVRRLDFEQGWEGLASTYRNGTSSGKSSCPLSPRASSPHHTHRMLGDAMGQLMGQ